VHEDRTVEDNEAEAELQEQEEATVGEKSNCGLLQSVESSRNVHRFTGYDKGLRKSDNPAINMELKSAEPYLLFHGSYPTVVGEKLNWRVAHSAESSSNVHRFTGHETLLRGNEADYQ
jgi:hypothetical protein